MPDSRIKTQSDFFREIHDLKVRFAKMEPELEVTIRDPDMGVTGYVVVWNTGICKGGYFGENGSGVGKGGTRILPNLELDDIKRLARAMAEKNAAAGLPLGGAKSGMAYDQNSPDYEQKYRRFVKLVQNSGILSENGGIFGGFGYDVGCIPPLNAQWACDELGSTASFTGKPVELGGTDYDREGIAGLGVATAAKTLFEHKKLPLENVHFSVQGLGAMGAAVAHYFSSYGAKLYCLSDPKYGGTWEIENGAPPELISALFAQDTDKAKSLLESKATLISDDSQNALYANVDIIFPCAMEDVLTQDNAHKVLAPYICEGANNPTTDEAHTILFESGKIAIPDIIANAGGIIAAYVELTSDITNEENQKTKGKVEEAKMETINRVSANTKTLLDIVETLDVQPNLAGDYIAYRNIFYGIK